MHTTTTTKSLPAFFRRPRIIASLIGACATLATAGGAFAFNESFRNNVLYWGGKHHHEHTTIIHDHRTFNTVHQDDNAASNHADARDSAGNTDRNNTALAADLEAEKRAKLDHRNRIRDRIARSSGETQTIQMTPD